MIQASQDTRAGLVTLVAQHRAKQAERTAADSLTRDSIQRVVGAIRSDLNHGPDSPLLTAMGYVTRSTRKSGLTRKTTPEPVVTAKS